MNFGWNFPLANHGNLFGYSGSGIDQFTDNPYGNLARETIQNSLDARIKGKMVKVEFNFFELDVDKMPGIEDFVKYIIKWNNTNGKTSTDENEKALMKRIFEALTHQNKMKLLRISDFNTTGLCGVSDRVKKDTAWFAFINGIGKNSKADNSGGSKGLGKNAIYANSIIRTMFVSTYTKNEERGFTGVTKLLSLIDDADKENPDWTQGIGYCIDMDDETSSKYNSPINELISLDSSFSREKGNYGTDIFIPCFEVEQNEDWYKQIIGESIISFLPAFIDGDLEIVLKAGGVNYYINHNSILYNVRDINNFKDDKQEKEASNIYKTLTSENKTVFNYDEKEGFEMKLYMLRDEINANNILYTYRYPTKMRIEKRNIVPFVRSTGVLLVKGEKLAKRLRAIEDATHSKWSKSKWKDSYFSKADIDEAYRILNNFIEDKVSKFGLSGNTGDSDFDFAKTNGWCSDDDVDSLEGINAKDDGLPTKDVQFVKYKDSNNAKTKKPLKRKSNFIDEEGLATNFVEGLGVDTENGNNELSHPNGHNNGFGDEKHIGDELNKGSEDELGNPTMIRKNVKTIECIMPSQNLITGEYLLIFIPSSSGESVDIEINKEGVSVTDTEKTNIVSASMEGSDLEIDKNIIHLVSIKRGEKYIINLKLEENKNFVWEVNVYANE